MKEGWKTKELCECLSYIKNGANIKQTKDASGIPITRIETLSGGEFHRDRLGYADIFDIGRFAQYILDDADILMSHINSKAFIGRSVIYHKQGDEQIIHGMNLLRLKFFTNLIYPEFANYYFKCAYFRNEVAKIRKDAVNQSSMAISDLKKIIIPTPSLSEQKHIVEELDLLSSIIEKKKAQLIEMDNLAQSLFYEMFGSDSYKIVSLEDVAEIKSTLISPIELPYSEMLHVSPANIVSGTGEIIDCIKAKDEKLISGKYTFSKGMVLYSKIRPNLNKVAIPKFSGICSADMYPLSIKDKANNVFVWRLLLSKDFLEYAINHSGRARMPKLNRETLFSYQFPLPPIDLQNRFAEKIQAIEHQKELIKKSIIEVETLFNSRMDDYFN